MKSLILFSSHQHNYINKNMSLHYGIMPRSQHTALIARARYLESIFFKINSEFARSMSPSLYHKFVLNHRWLVFVVDSRFSLRGEFGEQELYHTTITISIIMFTFSKKGIIQVCARPAATTAPLVSAAA